MKNEPAIRPSVVGIGELLWDILPDGRKPGGAPANFIHHALQFGCDARLVSAVGRDDAGDALVAWLEEMHIPADIARVPFPTGSVTVELDGAGVPTYDIRRHVAWDHIQFTDETAQLARQTKCVIFGSLAQRSSESRQTIARFVDAIPEENDPLIVFDANLRQDFYDPQLLQLSMLRCNVLKINDDELEVFRGMYGLPCDSVADAARALMARFDIRTVIVTCGATGSYVISGDETSYIATPPTEVVDTVGAGDSFTAAFVACSLRGMPLREAHQRAVDTAAFVCGQHGATPELTDILRR